MPSMSSFQIVPRGPFSLEASAGFGFGPTEPGSWDGLMRLAFCRDDFTGQAGVVLRQTGDAINATVTGDGEVSAVEAQCARILGLDQDATAWLAVGERDPVIAELQNRFPGLRPVQFHSPYEAACWSIIGARRQHRQAAAVLRRIGEEFGATFDLEGERLVAFPNPTRLLELETVQGLPIDRVPRLHAVAQAALDGRLDPARLAAMDVAAAMAELQELPGIGPFYATLIAVRACGATDALAVNEPRLLAAAAYHYGLPAPPTPPEFTRLAEPWSPFRTWATVLLRVAHDRPESP
jgi:DNA-3-methyladenine glycosylase II